MLDELHVVGRGIPDIVQPIPEGNLVVHRLTQQLLIVLVLGFRRAPFLLAILLVKVESGFGYQAKANGQGQPTGMLQSTDKVDPFDISPFGWS